MTLILTKQIFFAVKIVLILLKTKKNYIYKHREEHETREAFQVRIRLRETCIHIFAFSWLAKDRCNFLLRPNCSLLREKKLNEMHSATIRGHSECQVYPSFLF